MNTAEKLPEIARTVKKMHIETTAAKHARAQKSGLQSFGFAYVTRFPQKAKN